MKQRAILISITLATMTVVSARFAWSQNSSRANRSKRLFIPVRAAARIYLARAIAEMLQKEKLIPQRMQVVNKPGGGPAVAMSYLAEKKGETHTIGFFTGVWVTNPLTTPEANITVKDLTPIVRLVLEPAVIAVKADSPYKKMNDFVEAAKKNPKQARAIRRHGNFARQSHAPVAAKGHRRAVEFHFFSERRRAAVQSARRPRANDGDRTAGSRRADSRGKSARDRVAHGKAAGFVCPTCRPSRSRASTSRLSRRPAESSPRPACRAKWCNIGKEFSIALRKLRHGNNIWNKINSKTAISKGPPLGKFFDELTVQMRDVLKEAGAKVVR